MSRGNDRNPCRQVGLLFSSGATGGLTDGQLLKKFTASGRTSDDAEAAFTTLVARHGKLVWGICQRNAGNYHEAEDAFQATFLILARQAGSLWVGESLGGWLRRVATRVATRYRTEAHRRARMEAARARAEPDPWALAEREDLRVVVAEELARLPEKFRVPVELCHLRGLKQDEAARVLELPVGTVKSRLDRGKRRLRDALTRRGMMPAAALAVSGGNAVSGADGAIPVALVRATLRLAMGQIRGTAVVSARIVTMAKLGSAVGIPATLKQVVFLLLASSACTAGGLAVAGRGAWPSGGAQTSSATSPAQAPKTNRVVSPPEARKAVAAKGPSADPQRRRLGPPDVSGLVTSREAPDAPETDLMAAILAELRRERGRQE